MGNETIKQKTKNIIYELILPIFLWSIGMKNIFQYVEELTSEEMKFKNAHIKELQRKVMDRELRISETELKLKKAYSQLQKLQSSN